MQMGMYYVLAAQSEEKGGCLSYPQHPPAYNTHQSLLLLITTYRLHNLKRKGFAYHTHNILHLDTTLSNRFICRKSIPIHHLLTTFVMLA